MAENEAALLTLRTDALEAAAIAVEDEIVSTGWMADILAGAGSRMDKEPAERFVRKIAVAAVIAYITAERP